MLYITLEQVQDAIPEAHIYAWRWSHHPELGVYRAIAWMNMKYQGSDKVRYDKYFIVGLVQDEETVLSLIRSGLEGALLADTEKNLKRA